MSKQGKPKRGQPGGRYTPRGTVSYTPASRRAEAMASDDAVVVGLASAGRMLRARCDALLGDAPTTASEWAEADLMGMDGQDATDVELVAYWRLHRHAATTEALEMPELWFVMDALSEGVDPVAKWDAEWAEMDDDI